MYSLALSRDLHTQTHRISAKPETTNKRHSPSRLRTQQILISSNELTQHEFLDSETREYTFSNHHHQIPRLKHLNRESINEYMSEQVQCYKNIAEILSKENMNLAEQNSYLLQKLDKAKREQKKYAKMSEEAKKYKYLYLEALAEINKVKLQCEAYKQKATDLAIIAFNDLSKLSKKMDSIKENQYHEDVCYCSPQSKQKRNSYGKLSTRSSSKDGSIQLK